ncbi:MAG TPA: GNAT family N-acetyltransferase [Acidimicrobiia bacterium]|nr:GNAT family N-acetyltransferase [Acidimicrobiia bacterium]
MTPTVEIRDARDDDSLDLIALVARCWAQYPGCVLDVHGEEPELLAPGAAIPDGRWWVAVLGGRVLGSVALSPGEDGGVMLRKLYVDPTWRRRGLGTRLVEVVEAEASSRGANRIELWSDTRFEDAHRLYERLGYERQADTRELHDLSRTVEYRFVKPVPD